MNLSLVDLYPLLPVAWVALVLALAVWSGREAERRTWAGLTVLLTLAMTCVVVRDVYFGTAIAPSGGSESGQVWGPALLLAGILVLPGGMAGAGSFNWALRRGATWRRAFGLSAVIAVLASAVALIGAGVLLLLASGGLHR